MLFNSESACINSTSTDTRQPKMNNGNMHCCYEFLLSISQIYLAVLQICELVHKQRSILATNNFERIYGISQRRSASCITEFKSCIDVNVLFHAPAALIAEEQPLLLQTHLSRTATCYITPLCPALITESSLAHFYVLFFFFHLVLKGF